MSDFIKNVDEISRELQDAIRPSIQAAMAIAIKKLQDIGLSESEAHSSAAICVKQVADHG